ncbi:MAG TPA: YIP1 family protein [Holophagaceae bacterium]
MSETPAPFDPIPLAEPPVPPAPPIWEPPPMVARAPSLRPVPFEDLEAMPGFWERVGAMFRLVFTNPFELFDRVPVTDGMGAPWRFLLLLSVPIFLIMGAVFFFVGMGAAMATLEAKAGAEAHTFAALVPVIFAVILLLMPLFSFLGMVIGGALNHLFLWMWGGLKPGVGADQSIRAYGYASAFLQIGGLIPYLGILVQLAGIVVIGMGLARMHKTDTWRGVCAALTPLVLVCCCGGILIAMLVPAMIAAGHH